MRLKSIFYPFFLLLFISMQLSCNNQGKKAATKEEATKSPSTEVIFKDYGNQPTVLDIEEYTLKNDKFRVVLWTGKNIQLTVMSIPVGGDIGLEQHNDIDQFLRVESGKGQVSMGDTEDNLDFVKTVEDDDIILVPAGKWHNIVNIGNTPLKLYSIYGPAEHPHGTVHNTQADDPDFGKDE